MERVKFSSVIRADVMPALAQGYQTNRSGIRVGIWKEKNFFFFLLTKLYSVPAVTVQSSTFTLFIINDSSTRKLDQCITPYL